MELLVMASSHGPQEAGDIIDIRPDGFEWGFEEMADQIFDIIHVPDDELDGDIEEAKARLLTGIFGDDTVDESGNVFRPVLRYSKWMVTPSGNLVEKRKGPGNSVQQVVERALSRAPVDLPVKRRVGPRGRSPLPGQAGGPGSRRNPRG